MRVGLPLALPGIALIAGCSGAAPEASVVQRIECKLAEARAFARSCTVAHTKTADGRTALTIRHASGAARRFILAADGSGITAATGDAIAIVTATGGGGVEIALDGDRYRLPASETRPMP